MRKPENGFILVSLPRISIIQPFPCFGNMQMEMEYLPFILNLKKQLSLLASDWRNTPMLARTHGQAASPTTLGKEIMVFVERLENQVELLIQIPFTAKFGGATGNFNAHFVAFPTRDWTKLGNEFVEKKLGLKRQQFTTQIEHYDMLGAQFDCMKRINTILIDFCRDLWTYISMDYFKQQVKEGEIGSSAMPHKVNPIDFENAEGNLGLANALFEYLSAKLTGFPICSGILQIPPRCAVSVFRFHIRFLLLNPLRKDSPNSY